MNLEVLVSPGFQQSPAAGNHMAGETAVIGPKRPGGSKCERSFPESGEHSLLEEAVQFCGGTEKDQECNEPGSCPGVSLGLLEQASEDS